MHMLIKPLYAVLPGEIYPKTFASGSACPEALEGIALELGAIPAEDRPEKTAGTRMKLSGKEQGG